jgi:VWFA-related protein
MKHLVPTAFLLSILLLSAFLLSGERTRLHVEAQTRERTVGNVPAEVIKTDIDLITVDALVLQKKTARIVGNLTKDDFSIFEDKTKQQITHFSQDSLPLSVLLLIDRGGCLDPFGSEVRHAALDALSRLKPTDEVAVMTYHNTTRLEQRFTRNRHLIEEALYSVPEHDEMADHCLNLAFYDAADYMLRAGNPVGRRVVIVITGVTRNFDCRSGPSGKAAVHAILESGSVVCGLVPVTPDQKLENGVMRWATRMGGLVHAPTLNIKDVVAETGGEMLEDKPERLDVAFNTLITHLRTRYSLGFVSSNKKRDGTTRKLKIEVASPVKKAEGDLVIKARRSYVAPKS